MAGDAEGSLDGVFDGADRAFVMSAEEVGLGSPTQVPRLVEAARRAGVRHVAYLSVFSGDGGGDVIADWHRDAEAAVTGSGLAWTLLRPGRFFSNALNWAPMLRRGEVVHLPFADRAAAGIDPADIAAVAAAALSGDRWHGAVLPLTGPQAFTSAQEVGELGSALGRSLTVAPVSDEQARAGMVAHGMPSVVADAVVARASLGTDGAEVLSTVDDVLGRAPRSFAGWATDHADAFAR